MDAADADVGDGVAGVAEGLKEDQTVAVIGLALQCRVAKAMSPHSTVVRLIGPGNSGLGEEEWSPAVAAVPHAVRLAHRGQFHTIALDFDTRPNGVESAKFEAEIVQNMFAQIGVRSVIAESGPSGGRHVLFTVAAPGISGRDGKRLAEGLRDLGFHSFDTSQMTNHKTGAIRPLFSAHAKGGRSMPLYDSPGSAVEVLEQPNDPALVTDLIQVIWKLSALRPLRLATDSEHFMAASAPSRDTDSPSGSEPFMSFVLSAVNGGVQDVEALEATFSSVRADSTLGDYLARRGNDRRANRRALNKAILKVMTDPARHTGVPDAVVIRAWAEALPGMENALDPVAYDAAEAILGLAAELGRVLVGLSVRELALRIGIGRTKASGALRELREGGLLVIAGDAATKTGRRYRLVHPDQWTAEVTRTVGPSSLGGVSPQTVRRAATQVPELMTASAVLIWSPSGLGVSGRRVWAALFELCGAEGGVSAQELADAVGRSRRAVDNTLHKLQQHGLACRPPARGRWAPDFPSIEVVEKSLGIQEITAKRREASRREALRDRVRRVIHDMEQANGHVEGEAA